MKTENKIRNAIWVFVIGLCVACGSQNTEQSASSGEVEQPVATAENAPTSKGVGPISNYQPKAIEETMVKEGEELFTSKCSMCHRLDTKLVGPPLKGVTKRRSPEWLLNMMLDPDRMLAEDADAKALLKQYGAPMINVQLREEGAKAIYDYLRKQDL